ncbi:MAG: hypothetical protein PHN45_02800 [Methylococcales bacterium]|nr:hypothetical protein [Methylococcales bacterium]MDD5753660.1 hypothetical protein [Methylococcales bacterium]
MLSCKNITELASTRLDGRILWYRKMELTVHLMMCKRCRCYVKQLNFLQKAFKLANEKAAGVFLSEDARRRIKQKLNEVTK